MTQVVVFAVVAFGITYLYFYNIIISIIYALIAIAFIPYLAYLRCQKVYSEFIFEQIQKMCIRDRCNGNDCLWTNLPAGALPVSLITETGVFPFKFTFSNIGPVSYTHLVSL